MGRMKRPRYRFSILEGSGRDIAGANRTFAATFMNAVPEGQVNEVTVLVSS